MAELEITADWSAGPRQPVLSEGAVHLWAVALDAPDAGRRALAGLLAPDERTRAAGFHFDRHRNRFLVGRGTLRTILGRYTGIAPASLRFRYGDRGKPALDGPGPVSLRFNLSHSRDLAVLAVGSGREIGVDVEFVRPQTDIDAVAARFFTPNEIAALATFGDAERTDAFFRCWTRKEAYMKARGEGLFRSPRGFEVALGRDAEPRLVAVDGEPDEPARWSMRSFVPAAGCVGAVLAEGDDWELECYRWQTDPEADARRDDA